MRRRTKSVGDPALASRPPRPGNPTRTRIAAALFVREGTVETHVTHVLQKLGRRDRVQAVIFAYESGVVEPGG